VSPLPSSGQSTVKVGAGKFGEGLVFKLSMGVSHAEIDLQIAAERDANARDTPCLFCAPVDCRVGGLMEIILGKPKNSDKQCQVADSSGSIDVGRVHLDRS
jgi:hypothetical protein